MKQKKGKLRPFNNILFVIFEQHLNRLNYPPLEIYNRSETVRKYLKYLQETNQKVTMKKPQQREDYLNYLNESKGLKIKDLNQKKSDLELFYKFLDKYI
jgi:hypothetical protein